MGVIFNDRARSLARISLVVACAAWPVWLYGVDNAFTMGYITPPLRKIALCVVAMAVPLILWRLGWTLTKLLALLIAAITWPFLAILCVQG